ncbi:MAG: ImmA/IrrE family metallo-endopeptidase [Methanomassiliicoccales archaeon]|nr:MAG: ImmA/IrrE family metallo-endopeptidase [Methanomassiliicoccales archaeon]
MSIVPRSLKVEVNPKVFKWLRESSGWSIEDVAKRLKSSIEVVEAIEKGERQPTFRQLKELSNAYKRPLASFLLSVPIKERPLPKDYRMLSGKKDVFDKSTIYIIRKVRNLQEISKELSININYPTKPKVKRVTIKQNPEDISAYYRELFELTEKKQRKYGTPYEMFRYLRDNFEEMNILIFQFPMPIDDARAFALTDDLPNVIVVNKKDTIEARLFSLMHEFGHVLLGETVIDFPDISILVDNRKELWCNTFASSFLLPKKIANSVFKTERKALTETNTLNRLSRKYKVSKAMLLYNMLKQNFITRKEYEAILERYRPEETEPVDEGDEDKEEKKGGGIPSDRRCLSEVGNKFISIVANNYDRNYITFTDALNYLSIRSKNFDQVLAKARK